MSRLAGLVRLLLVVAVAGIVAPASADEVSRSRIKFPAGANEATVSGRIKGYDSAEYLVGARAGQRMRVHMDADNASSYFNVYAPGAKPGKSQALYIGNGNDFTAKLTRGGDYTIQVFTTPPGATRP